MAGAPLKLDTAPLGAPLPPKPVMPAAARPRRPAVPVESGADERKFKFTGTGGEYFRIWVVNLLLTILTLGGYSAWAKVRRLQYFYRNTRVDGSTFEYHGTPKAILKGRILALTLVLAYQVAMRISPIVALCIGAVLVAITPWLLARSFRFKLVNSSYRGLRLRFAGTALGAYKMLSLFPILATLAGFYIWNLINTSAKNIGMVTIVLGIAFFIVAALTVPYAHFLLKRFQHDNAYFGHTPVFFDARARDFFKIYLRALGLLSLSGTVGGWFAHMTRGMVAWMQTATFGWLFLIFYGVVSGYVFYLFVHPFLQSRIQNLVWNHTEIAGMRFSSTTTARGLLFIHLTNLALTVFTLGLYKPFAEIRLLKYRIECLTLIPDGDLETYMCDHAGDNTGAIGQEAGDLFDIEIAL
jgi:uncharacterized membrane protein YjgN (DUF898 family)